MGTMREMVVRSRSALAPRRHRSPRLRLGLVVALALAPSVPAASMPTAAATAPVDQAAPGCEVSELLVNPCRPWLGAVVDHYPGLSGLREEVEGHETRIGREVDVVHWYHPAGKVWLTSDERHLVDRGSILYLNWKPANRWAHATGGNVAVDAQIDTFADEIKSLGSDRIMLSIFGEPERFATPGTSACPGLKGSAGSPAAYKAMWANVQARFAARGVTNVVWVMNYLGYDGWDCFFPELWPGNERVDWITWDPYVKPGQTWDQEIGYFYDALEQKADATHDYTSKPWGLAEYGYWRGTADQTDAYRMYDDALDWVRADDHPRLKLYEIYDTISGPNDIRTAYDALGAPDPTEQALYNELANDPAFLDPIPPEPATDHLVGCDTGAELGLSCLSGTYEGTVWPTHHLGDGQTGTGSAQITNTVGPTGTYGLNVRPAPVDSTDAGRVYTGSVWVRASRVGIDVHLLLRERRPDRSAPPGGYNRVTWTATDTEWHLVEGLYAAKEVGNELTLTAYGSGMVAGEWVRYDEVGLTSQPS